MLYRLLGFCVRREACRLAAQAVQGPWSKDRDIAHLLWSLTVFFEDYMLKGAANTQEDFGPKEPVELGLVRGAKHRRAGAG
jgi:hypothetical protein